MKFIADILAALGSSAASVGTQGCMFLIIDEPKMPESLIGK